MGLTPHARQDADLMGLTPHARQDARIAGVATSLARQGEEPMTAQELWQRYQKYLSRVPALELSLDISRMNFEDDFLARMAPAMEKAYAAMDALEKGVIANPDENRMVGHYWLRNPKLAPTPEIRSEIENTLESIRTFAAGV